MNLRLRAAIAGLVMVFAPTVAPGDDSFLLKDGDHVVFYGDSITDQLLYTTFTETYAVTRYPQYSLSFTHSGWGGDRVGGGAGGSIDRRLARDVVAYRPSVVTIMLGMNDASYLPFKQETFDRYASGYRHIVEELKLDLPGVRLTLIKPSPYDDVTREPKFEDGYNSVLLRYADFISDLAKTNGATIADLNNPVVEATKKAYAIDREKATKFNPDRIHPGNAGQLIMAQALLKAWNAPSLVSAVALDAKEGKILSADKATVSELAKADETVSWTQLDESLPFPVDLKDPVTALATQTSDFFNALDRQFLKVDGLDASEYVLSIDRDDVGTFSKDQLNSGINLAEQVTPMTKQAIEVHKLTLRHNNLHKLRWRQVQVPHQTAKSEHLAQALEGLDGIEEEMVDQQRATAQPKAHKFVLKPKS